MTNVIVQMTHGIYIPLLVLPIIKDRKTGGFRKERGMDMEWMLILLIWFVYPVAGTIAIIVLGIMNSKYKKRIQELLDERQQMDGSREGIEDLDSKKEVETAIVYQNVAQLPKVGTIAPKPSWDYKKNQVHPGLASLIIGVIFVVMAGLIFATTNWNILPDLCKVIMIFGLSMLFFSASILAEKKLKIERTGRAFYILGSVFLFLTVLAVGYFRLLGPGFVLTGNGRWWVLWAGSVVTEAAFLLGFRRYQERVFTFVYLGGLTVSMTFLMAALRNCGVDFVNGMLCYAFALLVVGWLNGNYSGKSECGFLPENVAVVWKKFSMIHFIVFSGLMVPKVLLGFLAGYGDWWLKAYRITPFNVFCVGLTAVGMAIIAAGQKERRGTKIWYRIAAAVFLQYAVMGIPVGMEYRHLIAVVFHAGWFIMARRKPCWIWTKEADGICTIMVVMNAGILLLCAWKDMDVLAVQLIASAALLILAGVARWLSADYPGFRRAVFYILGALTVTGYGLCISTGIQVEYHHILFGYLVFAAAWDVLKKDSLWIDILLLGSAGQVFCNICEIRTFPYFLLLSVYLFLKKQETGCRRTMLRWGSLYSLLGVYVELIWWSQKPVLAMLGVTALLAAEYLIAVKRDGIWGKDWFWDVAASMVCVALMLGFYWEERAGIAYLPVCVCVFYLLYGKVYRGNCVLAHLPMSIVVLPLPWYLAEVSDFSDNQILGGAAAVVLISGILFRLYGPVYENSKDGKRIRQADWYHILAGPVFLILSGGIGRRWGFVYGLILILYVLQFAMIPEFKKGAVTAAMIMGIRVLWMQPFIMIPNGIWLEMNLLPVLGLAACLPRIWGKCELVDTIQNGIGTCCLIVLTAEALLTGTVEDALMLEAICLLVFLTASKKDIRYWKYVSGSVLILVVLYMTKGFWLSLSWWIYLLAAGIALILFAAWNERKRR